MSKHLRPRNDDNFLTFAVVSDGKTMFASKLWGRTAYDSCATWIKRNGDATCDIMATN